LPNRQLKTISPITNVFSINLDGDDWDKAKEFMLEKFLAKNRNPEKQIYPHFTCATDSNSIRYVINAVEHTVIRNALKELGVF
jgi:guanine nucleotide-binding protein G(i) subunit alpha